MFFRFDEVWNLQLAAIFGLIGAVLGFLVGRFGSEKRLPQLQIALGLAPVVGSLLWILVGTLQLGARRSLIEILLGVLFAQLLLVLQYVAFLSLAAAGYFLGRRFR